MVEPAGPVDDNGEFPVNFPVLVIEGLDTSDGRLLAAGGLTHRALPLSLLAQPESAHGGDDAGPAGIVGRIDTLTRTPGPEVISKRTGEPFPDGTFIWSGTGHMRADAKVGAYDIADLFQRGYLRGISVDLAGMDYEVLGDEGSAPRDPDNPRRMLIAHAAEIAAATLVPIPAFGDAYGEMADTSEQPAPPAAADLPEGLAASAAPAWRSAEVGDRMSAVALVAAADQGMPVRIPPDSVEQLVTVIDTGEDRDAQQLAEAVVEHIALNWALTEPVGEDELPDDGSMSTPAAALADDPAAAEPEGELEDEGDPAEPQACIYDTDDHPAVRSLLYQDGAAFVSVCDAHDQQARDELAKAGETVSGEVAIDGAEPAEAVVASADLADLPPLAWFQDPQLPDLTPLTVTSDGRVFGHLASWQQDHVGLPGQRIRPPRSAADYAYFHVGALTAASPDGPVDISVGKLTMDTGHATTDLGAQATVAHYDHSGSVIAQVCCGEDAHGIWYAGVLMPGVDELTVRRFRGCGLSGDWRRIGSGLELVAALSVPVPGFPVPRARVASGQPLALVAAGAVLPEPVGAVVLDYDTLADAIASRLEARGLSAESAALLADLDERPAEVVGLLSALDERPAEVVGLLAELSDSSLDDVEPDDADFNWVDEVGGLPKYIKRIAKHLQEKGQDESRSIATAVNVVKKMCATGDLNFPGSQQVNSGSRAEACAATAEWEAKKARAKAT